MILESADVRVRRGYEWLKTEGPALGLYVTRLNPTLDIEDYWNCAMAQASGGTYGTGMRKVHGNNELGIDWAMTHGFMSASDSDGLLLTQIWRDTIILDGNLSHAATA